MRPLLARRPRLLLAVLLVALAVPAAATSSPQPQRSIIAFEGEVDSAAIQGLERVGAEKIKELELIDAVVVYLPSKAAEKAVRAQPGVKSVEPDIAVKAHAPKAGKGKPAPSGESVPWGVSRVNADDVWASETGDGVKVAIVDTGVDTGHSDLIVAGGTSAVAYTTSYNDDNGHGTHVAGTVAAVDNSIGVVGVAPASGIYAVKVLDRRGNGYLSDVIEGLQWAANNDMDVVNMSLGTSVYSSSFDLAVKQTIASGVVVVASAGNSGPGADTVEYPARFDGVIGVGATSSSDGIASFSSRGSQVDLAAPGVSILSTYKRNSYTTMSGTSMASPHVAGVAALVLGTSTGADDLDGDDSWDPVEVERRLERTAQDLGAAGFDTSFGNGLVQADGAVSP